MALPFIVVTSLHYSRMNSVLPVMSALTSCINCCATTATWYQIQQPVDSVTTPQFLVEYRPFLAETTRPVYTTIAAVPEEFF
jgi:hypothetical protein